LLASKSRSAIQTCLKSVKFTNSLDALNQTIDWNFVHLVLHFVTSDFQAYKRCMKKTRYKTAKNKLYEEFELEEKKKEIQLVH
jgi:hypothetical protein